VASKPTGGGSSPSTFANLDPSLTRPTQIHALAEYKNHPFRDELGRKLYQMLFLELSKNKDKALYTLKDFDYEGKRSLYLLYMAKADPTEYAFATEYFDGIEHWNTLCRRQWFSPHILRWREELDLKIKSEALRRLISDAKSGSKSSHQANRFLLEKGWVPKDGKGRPSKDQVQRAAKAIAEEDKTTKEDYLRVIGD
jgi:hypothetical protein